MNSLPDERNEYSSLYESPTAAYAAEETHAEYVDLSLEAKPGELERRPAGLDDFAGTDDFLTRFLADKERFLEKSIGEILGQIDSRYALRDDHIYRIDLESCRTKEQLFELDAAPGAFGHAIQKVRTNVVKELIAFEKEKRGEETACWRDVTRLTSDLREVVRELWQERRKRMVVGSDVP